MLERCGWCWFKAIETVFQFYTYVVELRQDQVGTLLLPQRFADLSKGGFVNPPAKGQQSDPSE